VSGVNPRYAAFCLAHGHDTSTETFHRLRLAAIGDECPRHPGETIGAYGCPACRAGENWRKRGHVAYVGVGSRP
jgi:hypothetical protein